MVNNYLINFIVFLIFLCNFRIDARCPNNCNKHGVCRKTGLCDCDTGYEGNDCGRKQCSLGYSLGAAPYANDQTHRLVMCSDRGTCDYDTGLCKCDAGFSGGACQTMGCTNGCSGHGTCLTLKQAAEYNDGYMFNRTTTYANWDKDTFTGCACEPGYEGYDCSVKSCPFGLDPRESSVSYETATLVCTCSGTCQKGKFKLKYKGVPTQKWLSATSKGFEVGDALMSTLGVGISANNSKLYRYAPIRAYKVVSSTNDALQPICADTATTRTIIRFNKDLGEVPALSFYGNMFTGGSIYFETTQTLTCDCSANNCHGKFRVSFDGQMSSALVPSSTQNDVISALNGMATFANLGITLTSNAGSSAVCANSATTVSTFTMAAQMGNIPNIGIYGSLARRVTGSAPYGLIGQYRTNRTASVLSFSSANGNTQTVKECNGLGSCLNGQCICAPGWGVDLNLGPCGSLIVNSSIHGGFGRCPGLVNPSDLTDDMTEKPNYVRVYISVNPDPAVWDNQRRDNSATKKSYISSNLLSTIEYYDWLGSVPDMLEESGRMVLCSLATNRSAGAMVLDNANDRIIYFDWNGQDYANYPSFLGSVKVSGPNKGVKTTFISNLGYRIFGLAIDSDIRRRKIYWTVPGANLGMTQNDGGVFWSYLDAGVAAVQLSAGNTVNPMGIAVHSKMNRLFWIDRDSSTKKQILSSCRIPNTDITDDQDVTSDSQCAQYQVIEYVEGRAVSKNITDIVIDFYSNNTLFFIDSGTKPSIMGINLDKPLKNNATYQWGQFSMMYEAHIVVDSLKTSIVDPRYLTIDTRNEVILWSDTILKRVNFARYVNYSFDPFSPGVAYTGNYKAANGADDIRFTDGTIANPYVPVGLLYDPGYGTPVTLGPTVDCYGHGRCLGASGNWKCECDAGYVNNCNMRTCPKGRAWFHEPVVDNKAHDVVMECSNMGVCDRTLGFCACRAGFEGPACERMSCQGKTNGAARCGNAGKCMSLNELAGKTSYTYGSIANDPATWDSRSIQGCYADTYGYLKDVANSQYSRNIAVSSRSNLDRLVKDSTKISYINSPIGDALRYYACPSGYRLRDKDVGGYQTAANNSFYHGIQRFTCQATGGSFSFKYKDFTSELILFSDTHTIVQKKLEAVQTIGRVSVQQPSGSSTSTICGASSVQADIHLISQVGATPLLAIVSNTLSGGTVISTIGAQRISVGTIRECSGNGICDGTVGECRCFEGFGSSDGYGNQGDMGDCGYNLLQ